MCSSWEGVFTEDILLTWFLFLDWVWLKMLPELQIVSIALTSGFELVSEESFKSWERIVSRFLLSVSAIRGFNLPTMDVTLTLGIFWYNLSKSWDLLEFEFAGWILFEVEKRDSLFLSFETLGELCVLLWLWVLRLRVFDAVNLFTIYPKIRIV